MQPDRNRTCPRAVRLEPINRPVWAAWPWARRVVVKGRVVANLTAASVEPDELDLPGVISVLDGLGHWPDGIDEREYLLTGLINLQTLMTDLAQKARPPKTK